MRCKYFMNAQSAKITYRYLRTFCDWRASECRSKSLEDETSELQYLSPPIMLSCRLSLPADPLVEADVIIAIIFSASVYLESKTDLYSVTNVENWKRMELIVQFVVSHVLADTHAWELFFQCRSNGSFSISTMARFSVRINGDDGDGVVCSEAWSAVTHRIAGRKASWPLGTLMTIFLCTFKASCLIHWDTVMC